MKGLSKAVGDLTDSIERNDTAFDTRIADGTQNRIDASGEYPFNTGRHRFLENGAFTFDDADTTALSDLPAKMQVTAGAGDEHVFGARELVRYVPNYELLFGTASWSDAQLSEGQHFAKEFMNADATEGYRYHYEGTADDVILTLEQYQGGTLVDSVEVDLDPLRRHGFRHEKPHLARCFLNWYGAGLARFELSYPRRDPETGQISDQVNKTVGRTANDDDVATDRINLRVQTRVWAEAGADPVTVNICSNGALIRGSAEVRSREKPAVMWDVGGAISQYPTENVADAVAARIDPNRRDIAVQAEPPLFAPGGSGILMELSVYAIHEDHPDLTVNFNDPDDDGVDEGPSPAAQSRADDDVMQYTRDVTSIPTDTDIRADATTGLVPNMRHITSTVGSSGGGNQPSATTGGELNVKRNIYPNDIVIFLPRTDPNGSTTNGRIRWLKPLFEQDW